MASTHDHNQVAPKAVQQAFAMSKGDDETSYSKNSYLQAHMNAVYAMPRLEEALQHANLPPAGEPIVVADLGCSSGQNSIDNIAHIVKALRARLSDPREVQAFFNDLPSNDFNTLFQGLSRGIERNFFAAGVPGSFYDRLFPKSRVHVFLSTICLHFLSKIPDEIYDKTSPAFNGGAIHIDDAPPAVEDAYKKQSATDLENFLHARAAELAPGGLLFFFAKGSGYSGKGTKRHLSKDDSIDAPFTTFTSAWKSLESKGLLTKEQTAEFNFPFYFRTLDEVKEGISRCSSEFRTYKIEMLKFKGYVDAYEGDLNNVDRTAFCKGAIALFRGGFGTYMEGIIGREKADIFWDEFNQLLYRDAFEQLFGNTNMFVVALLRK